MDTGNPFEPLAAEYDSWFDTAAGAKLFQLELECLNKAVDTQNRRWLEVGVGSGRFAAALGIGNGADPSPAMVKIAATRGIETVMAPAETLPFSDQSFDGVLMAFSICFVQNPVKALNECHRVLKVDGTLVIGFIPADSLWGEYHARQGRKGHRFYAAARFYTSAELRRLAEQHGFICKAEYTCQLPPPPPENHSETAQNRKGSDNGFIVLSFSIAMQPLDK